MKLSDFLNAQGRARPAPTRPINFKVLGRDQRASVMVADASAELAFVPEGARQEALRDADKIVMDAYGSATVPTDRREDERAYHVLYRALRDKDDPRQPFADSISELKGALVLPEAQRLYNEYKQFEAEEFPDIVDAEMFERMVEEAKKNSLSDLLSSFGFDVVRRSMPGLISRLGKSLTQT